MAKTRGKIEQPASMASGKAKALAHAKDNVAQPLLKIRQFAALIEAEGELGALERILRRERDTRKASRIASVRKLLARAMSRETDMLLFQINRAAAESAEHFAFRCAQPKTRGRGGKRSQEGCAP